MRQHDLVVEQFGANAWDNVSYTLREIEPADGNLGYRVKSTGELLIKRNTKRSCMGIGKLLRHKRGLPMPIFS